MSLRLVLAEFHLPRFIRRRKFLRLMRLTAEAFGTPCLAPASRSFEAMLDAYAMWTQEQAERIATDKSRAAAVRSRLRGLAFEFGQGIRDSLGLRTRTEVLRAGRLLYRLLQIDFEGKEPGDIIFRRCFFSQCFSAETCALMASLDEGVLAGLSGGGRLEFSSRITENNDVCRARFIFPENLP